MGRARREVTVVLLRSSNVFSESTTARNPGTQELFPESLQVMRRKCRWEKKRKRKKRVYFE